MYICWLFVCLLVMLISLVGLFCPIPFSVAISLIVKNLDKIKISGKFFNCMWNWNTKILSQSWLFFSLQFYRMINIILAHTIALDKYIPCISISKFHFRYSHTLKFLFTLLVSSFFFFLVCCWSLSVSAHLIIISTHRKLLCMRFFFTFFIYIIFSFWYFKVSAKEFHKTESPSFTYFWWILLFFDLFLRCVLFFPT